MEIGRAACLGISGGVGAGSQAGALWLVWLARAALARKFGCRAPAPREIHAVRRRAAVALGVAAPPSAEPAAFGYAFFGGYAPASAVLATSGNAASAS